MSTLPKLRFPSISSAIKRDGNREYIWDNLRGQFLVLTPEEWVRQHLIGWLVNSLHIPALRIVQEYAVDLNGTAQRADVVVIDDCAKPLLLAECKSFSVEIDEAVLNQAVRYNSIVGARYILLTNGRNIFIYERTDSGYKPMRTTPQL